MADPDLASPSGAVESEADFGEPPQAIAKRWIAEIQDALDARRIWWQEVEKVLKRYTGEKPQQLNASQRRARFNVLWSNVNTLTPALYAKRPSPQVERTQKDADPVGRAAAQIEERALRIEVDEDFDELMRRAVFDYVTAGQGQGWVRYEPTFGDDGAQIRDEDVEPDYVHWRDYLDNPSRTWKEKRWVARRHFWTRAQMKAMDFPDWKTIPLNYDAKQRRERQNEKTGDDDIFMKSECWEIWDKDTRQRLYINVGWDKGPLKKPDDDPHGHDEFFPCPRPLLATTTNDSTVPIPDYIIYEDQALALDKLTQRLDAMVAACRAVGLYDKSFPELARLFSSGDTKLFPVDNWERFAKANGFTGTLALLPIEGIVAAITVLTQAKAAAKADLDELTGLSDIIRGETDPRETATAQGIKGQYAALRLRDRQAEVTRFGRDMIRLMGEVVANKFQPEKLAEMSGVDYTAAQQAAAAPMAGAPTMPQAPQAPPQQPMPMQGAQQ